MDIQELIAFTCQSVVSTDCRLSRCSPEVLELEGMSSQKIRHLLNNLCSFKGCRYLEVGSFKGSTLCSALDKNPHLFARSYENFSEFTSDHGNNVESILQKNIERFKGNAKVQAINGDFFAAQPNGEPPFNVYFYDGCHTVASQYLQLKVAKPFLAKYSIVLIDDWFCNVSKPKYAMYKAVTDFNFHIHLFIELPSGAENGYWAGIGLFILENL